MHKVKEGYKLAQCCSPQLVDAITGYHSHNDILIVHRATCENLNKAEVKRLVSLSWTDILEKAEEEPDKEYNDLDETDFRILRHHQSMGVDYSWMVASALDLDPELVFERHRKLKDRKLLKRVGPVMIQYRRTIVDHKWIKHRNHTYYQITPRGEKYLSFFISHNR